VHSAARSVSNGLRRQPRIPPPTWRVESGKAATGQAFSFSCCSTLNLQAPATARLKTRQPFEPFRDKQALPTADRNIDQQQGSPRLLCRSVTRQGDQVGAVFGRQKARAKHTRGIPNSPPAYNNQWGGSNCPCRTCRICTREAQYRTRKYRTNHSHIVALPLVRIADWMCACRRNQSDMVWGCMLPT
jgi:hypothetical protein